MSETSDKDLSRYYVWFDSEFTSLDMERSRLLQVAMVVTDHRLRRVAAAERDLTLHIRISESEKCDPWVEENLSSLVARCRSDDAVSLEETDRILAERLDDILGASPGSITARPVMAGNSIQSDSYLAGKFLPTFKSRLNYRVIDVSSWKVHLGNASSELVMDKENREVVREWFPGEFNSDASEHDAHYDVLASIAELNFYCTRLGLTGFGA